MPKALDAVRLRERLIAPGAPWTAFDVVAQTGSTNADLASGARSGTAAVGSILLSELQLAGRGRLGRDWQAPPGKALTFSVLVSPGVPVATWGWLPLLTGVALVDAMRPATGVAVGLKWPNDLLAPDGRKLAGILTERVDTAAGSYAVIGMGVNVSQTAAELPVDTASSLAIASGHGVDREQLLVLTLDRLADQLRAFRAAAGDPDVAINEKSLRSAYRACSATLDQQVRVQLPGEQQLLGTAIDVDPEGRLVVRPNDGSRDQAIAAGDVIHLR